MKVNWASLAARMLPRAQAQHDADLAGTALVLDRSGALYWPEEGLLVVSDLHLEKGSSFAVRGSLLPPYDTHDTLVRLGEAIVRYAPRIVVALGDNFHDNSGAERLAPQDRETLLGLQRGREWVWITGNHDPEPADGVGGTFAEELVIGTLWFRHKSAGGAFADESADHPFSSAEEGTTSPLPPPLAGEGRVGAFVSFTPPDAACAAPPSPAGEGDVLSGEISGHLHPVAVVAVRGVGVRRRCFVTDGARLVMPAFGAYAGGLNIRHSAFADVFGGVSVTAHVLGDERVFAIPADRCV